MAHIYPEIDKALEAWITKQAMFFVATAPLDGDGHVNVSPKGPIGSLRVLSPTEVAYLDVIGSGAETAAHIQENGRIVVMFCAFEGPPRILRLHGRGRVIWSEDAGFEELVDKLDVEEPDVGASRRAVIHVEVTRIADSCGFGVPLMEVVGHRDNYDKWCHGKVRKEGVESLQEYKRGANSTSIDGLPAWELAPAGS
jgi:hypothetical protein